VSFAAITLCVASQRVLIIVVFFFIDSVRKLLDTTSQLNTQTTLPLPYRVRSQICQHTEKNLYLLKNGNKTNTRNITYVKYISYSGIVHHFTSIIDVLL
jgi:hypothetical protein